MDFSQNEMQFWGLSAPADQFSALPDDDFIAILQKAYAGGTVAPNHIMAYEPAADSVNPQNLTRFPVPSGSPPSSDSSPSPPSTVQHETSRSRRQSTAFDRDDSEEQDEPRLKRKASDESMEDAPTAKNQHTNSGSSSSKKVTSSSSSRRKSGTQDEARLLKRKEQNRAAQRAFRERKEKHVKDLEDKVAALEAKNQMSEAENENLRDLLQRLQSENMMLKQSNFTFSAPRETPTSRAQPSNTFSFDYGSVAGPSKSPAQQPQQSSYGDMFNQLIPFDPNMLNPAEDTPDMVIDSPYGYPTPGQYKTLASNPMYTSFAEPSPGDNLATYSQPAFDMSFSHIWSPPESGQDALDQLLGGNFGAVGPGHTVDFNTLLSSPPSSLSPAALSPISHTNMRTPSLSSSSSTPEDQSASPASTAGGGSHDNCPKTKQELKAKISEAGSSSFVSNASPFGANGAGANPAGSAESTVKKTTLDDGGPIVMCRGSSFPKTEKNERNVDVLQAWRSITSNPQFRDLDINELCAEFTSKARCDGTKVVLEPEGVHHIVETLAARHAAAQQHK